MPSRRLSIASAWRSSAPAVSPSLQPVARLAHVALGVAQRLARGLAGLARQPALQLLHQLAQRLLPLGELPARRPARRPGLALRLARLPSWPSCCPAWPARAELALQLLEALVRQPLLLAQRVGEALHRLLALAALARPAALLAIIICMFSSICCSISSSASASALRPCSRQLLDAVHQLLDLVLGHGLARRDLAPAAARRARSPRAPSAPCSRASPGAARPSAGRSPRRWRRSRSASCSRSLARASRSAASPRLPSSICTAACQSASATSSLHRRHRRRPPRPAPAGGSPSARRGRRAGCRRPSSGRLVTARSTWVTRRPFVDRPEQVAALLDQRRAPAGRRSAASAAPPRCRRAGAGLAGRVLGRQPHRHRQPGEGMLGEVLDQRLGHLAGCRPTAASAGPPPAAARGSGSAVSP